MINVITTDITGLSDKQALVLFGQALRHRRRMPTVKQHTYELNTVHAQVKSGKTIKAVNVKECKR